MKGKNRKGSEKPTTDPLRIAEPEAELTPFRRRVEQVKKDVDFDRVIERMREIEQQFVEFGHQPLELLDDGPPN